MILFDAFTEWAESRFGDIKIKGNEIRANSIFHPTKSDTKFRLWMKPSGTTKKGERFDGVYHCFDTNQKGTLTGLVMLVDKCTYSEACDKIGGGTNLVQLEKKVEEFFANKYKEIDLESELKTQLSLPEGSVPLSYSSSDYSAIDACFWLDKRKMPVEGLFFCTEGKYKGRIVIPYYDRDGNLIYYNTRTMGKGSRYLGPPKEIGAGKEDVVFAYVWPKTGTKVYLTEGEFDAIALNQCGLFAAAVGGKNLSDKQLELLSGYKICLALDNDSAGRGALLKMYEKLRSHGLEISYVSPPKTEKIKDWNNLYVLSDEKVVNAFIERHEKPFTEKDFLNISFEFLPT